MDDQDEQLLARFAEALRARDEAKNEFEVTPAGFRYLEQKIAHTGSPVQRASLEEQLRLRHVTREMMISVLKRDAVDSTHQVEKRESMEALPVSLSEDGQVLPQLATSDTSVQTSLDESLEWVAVLNDDEQAAMLWYTEDGYDEINRFLATGSVARGNVEALAPVVDAMDSALKKQPRPVEKVVYRRHFFYPDAPTEDGMFAHLTLEQMQERFAVGSEFQHSGYMSTSLDPGNLPSGNSLVAALEIKTSSAVSLAGVARQGTGEQEYLIPREARFRVVANDRRVQVDRNGVLGTGIVVFQLEEILD